MNVSKGRYFQLINLINEIIFFINISKFQPDWIEIVVFFYDEKALRISKKLETFKNDTKSK